MMASNPARPNKKPPEGGFSVSWWCSQILTANSHFRSLVGRRFETLSRVLSRKSVTTLKRPTIPRLKLLLTRGLIEP
jgi:hypothetical protein